MNSTETIIEGSEGSITDEGYRDISSDDWPKM